MEVKLKTIIDSDFCRLSVQDPNGVLTLLEIVDGGTANFGLSNMEADLIIVDSRPETVMAMKTAEKTTAFSSVVLHFLGLPASMEVTSDDDFKRVSVFLRPVSGEIEKPRIAENIILKIGYKLGGSYYQLSGGTTKTTPRLSHDRSGH